MRDCLFSLKGWIRFLQELPVQELTLQRGQIKLPFNFLQEEPPVLFRIVSPQFTKCLYRLF